MIYNDKNDYRDKLLTRADEIASSALVKFYEKIGLDSNLCVLVNNIIPVIGEVRNGGYAHYDEFDDNMVISGVYLDEMVNHVLNESPEFKEKMEGKIIYNIAQTIMHERIHALRRIRTPKNIIPTNDPKSNSRRELVREFGESYNYAFPCDVILDNHSSITNINDLLEILRQQDALEEAVTEAFSQIIIYNSVSKFSDFSLSELANKVMNDDNDFVVSGAKIIDAMDDNMIKWFITTRYSDAPYKDLFYEKFGDDYYILLSDMEEIDKSANSGNFPPKIILEEFDKILSSHKSEKGKSL